MLIAVLPVVVSSALASGGHRVSPKCFADSSERYGTTSLATVLLLGR
ncbi:MULTISPECIES: hypothetical protein [Modestobacter]|nr:MULTISPECIES: hypothetical protein [Modestobacter]